MLLYKSSKSTASAFVETPVRHNSKAVESPVTLFLHLSSSRWFCGHWPWGFCKPLDGAWTKLWQGADRRHPGASPGAWQGLLHPFDRKLPAQLLRLLHPFAVSAEGAHPGHAARDASGSCECSHVQNKYSVLDIAHKTQNVFFITLQIYNFAQICLFYLNFSLLCLFWTLGREVWRWGCSNRWKASRHS